MGVPMLIGAGIGGAISAARGGNPLTGALLGGLTGGIGSSVLGAASAAVPSAITPALNVATAGGVEALKQGLFAGGGNLAGLTTGVSAIPAAPAATGLFSNTMSGIGKDWSAVESFAKENPLLTNQAGGMAKSLLMPEQQAPVSSPSAVLARGQQMQQVATPYAIARPNVSLI